MRYKFLSFALVLAIAFTAVAQQQPPALEATTPSVERLRAHVSYLASDKLEGRRTGSPGANIAAEYIAGEFARYGLRRSVGRDLPGMSILEADSLRRYMQEFPFVSGVELGKNNSMMFSSLDLRLGEDWLPLGFSSSNSLKSAPVIFVGYGITSAEQNYDDYSIFKKSGGIAVALAGTPDGNSPHGKFAGLGEPRFKAAAARAAGARALVLVASEDNFKNDKLTSLKYDNAGGDAGLPVVVVSRQAAAKIIGLTGAADFARVEKALAEREPPNIANRGDGGIFPIDILRLPTKGKSLSITTDITRRNAPAYNVIGILDGSDPVLKNEFIVIGAHYDHLGRGGEGSLAPREGEIHHGADDNASGVAGLLELARIFSADRKNLRRSIVFIAFSGEEEGLLGSNFYVNHPIVPLDKTVAMINMDMIGRMKDNRLMIGGVGTASEWRKWIEGTSALGRMVTSFGPVNLYNFSLTLNEDGYGPSDHSSFYSKQVPVLFFFTGTHDDYHKPSDTAEKINYEDEARIITFISFLMRSIDMDEKRPGYTVAKSESQGRSMSFRVYLGTIPSYAEANDGLRLDGVREDSPAAKAGLKAGDRITRLGGREVRNVYDYTYALGEMKAGQEYEVELVRGTETLKLKITPAARK